MISNIIFAIVYLTHTGFSHDGEEITVLILQISFLYIAILKDSLSHFLDSQNGKEVEEIINLFYFSTEYLITIKGSQKYGQYVYFQFWSSSSWYWSCLDSDQIALSGCSLRQALSTIRIYLRQNQ